MSEQSGNCGNDQHHEHIEKLNQANIRGGGKGAYSCGDCENLKIKAGIDYVSKFKGTLPVRER